MCKWKVEGENGQVKIEFRLCWGLKSETWLKTKGEKKKGNEDRELLKIMKIKGQKQGIIPVFLSF